MTTGENIRTLRTLRGLTQRELGDRVGVTSTSVSEWERDQNEPRAYALQRLAEVLGVSMERLREGPPFDSVDASALDCAMPVYARAVAGEPVEPLGVFWAPPSVLETHPRAFYLRITDDGMDRKYLMGSLAVIDPDLEPSSGDSAAVCVDEREAVVRQVLIGTSSITLVPLTHDPLLKDETFDLTRVAVVGTVVWNLVPFGDEFDDFGVYLPPGR